MPVPGSTIPSYQYETWRSHRHPLPPPIIQNNSEFARRPYYLPGDVTHRGVSTDAASQDAGVAPDSVGRQRFSSYACNGLRWHAGSSGGCPLLFRRNLLSLEHIVRQVQKRRRQIGDFGGSGQYHDALKDSSGEGKVVFRSRAVWSVVEYSNLPR